jgi:hypothetical protein
MVVMDAYSRQWAGREAAPPLRGILVLGVVLVP